MTMDDYFVERLKWGKTREIPWAACLVINQSVIHTRDSGVGWTISHLNTGKSLLCASLKKDELEKVAVKINEKVGYLLEKVKGEPITDWLTVDEIKELNQTLLSFKLHGSFII